MKEFYFDLINKFNREVEDQNAFEWLDILN